MNQQTWEKIEREFERKFSHKEKTGGRTYHFCVAEILIFLRQKLEQREKEILEEVTEEIKRNKNNYPKNLNESKIIAWLMAHENLMVNLNNIKK